METHPTAGRSGRSWASLGRLALRLALVLLVAAAGTKACRQHRAHLAVRSSQSPAGLERALALDPTEPEFLIDAGILHRDRLESLDLERARQYMDQAIELNPHEWSYRFEKAHLLEAAGRVEQAEATLLEALALTPHGSEYRWRTANFFARRGDVARTLEHLEIALAGSRDLQQPGFELLRQLGVDPPRMAEVWPRDGESSRRLLTWLIERSPTVVEAPTALAVRELWSRVLVGSKPPSQGALAYYLRYLLAQGFLDEARTEWIGAARRRSWEAVDFAEERNFVWNGGFELPLSKGPLDWYVIEKDSARTQRPRIESAPQGTHVLALALGGEDPGAFRGLTQQVVVRGGGSWEVAAHLRSEGAASGVRYVLDVRELPTRRLLFASAPVEPTSQWITLSGAFELPADRVSRLLLLRLGPDESSGGGHVPGHRLWIDAVRLAPSPGSALTSPPPPQ